MSHGDSLSINGDLIDHIKPAIRKNLDIAVIYTGTNDLQNKETVKHCEKGKETDKCSKIS